MAPEEHPQSIVAAQRGRCLILCERMNCSPPPCPKYLVRGSQLRLTGRRDENGSQYEILSLEGVEELLLAWRLRSHPLPPRSLHLLQPIVESTLGTF